MSDRGNVIEEFVDFIPKHVDGRMDSLIRNELEWKHISFAMADEITRLRDEVEKNKANIEIIKKMARDLNLSVDLRIGLHKAADIMEAK